MLNIHIIKLPKLSQNILSNFMNLQELIQLRKISLRFRALIDSFPVKHSLSLILTSFNLKF